MPFIFDEKTNSFEQRGTRKANWISGYDVMRSDDRLFGWLDNKWKSLDDSVVYKVASGRGGRLLKIDYDTDKVF